MSFQLFIDAKTRITGSVFVGVVENVMHSPTTFRHLYDLEICVFISTATTIFCGFGTVQGLHLNEWTCWYFVNKKLTIKLIPSHFQSTAVTAQDLSTVDILINSCTSSSRLYNHTKFDFFVEVTLVGLSLYFTLFT